MDEIEKRMARIFALAKKLSTESYDSKWKQLDDASEIGVLAEEAQVLRKAHHALEDAAMREQKKNKTP